MKSIYPIKLSLVLIILCCASCSNQVQSKKVEVAHNALGRLVPEIETGIWCIFQDQNNVYWFGSNGSGVFRYDGKTFRQLTKEDGLAGNQLRSIQADAAGNLYFGTTTGVSKFDGASFTNFSLDSAVAGVWEITTSDLWFKGDSRANGVYRYAGDNFQFLEFPEYDLESTLGVKDDNPSYSPYGVYSIYRDAKGGMWFGTLAAGVFHYDNDAQWWIAEKELSVLADGRVPGVRSIIEDKDGDFWLGNTLNRYRVFSNGAAGPVIQRYEKRAGMAPAPGAPLMEFPYYNAAVRGRQNDDLWMITYGDGVWRYDGVGLTHYPVEENGNTVNIFSIYADHQGALWLGTHSGVYIFAGDAFIPFAPR